jgi:hypothetical protein
MIVVILCFLLQPAGADQVDVVVQAGHQGRPKSCKPMHVKHCNLGARLGTQREQDWTPIVAHAAATELQHDGFTVKYRPADYRGHDRARAAVFLHFDGNSEPCSGGASVGFPPGADRAFVHDWVQRYRAFFPYHFAGENISHNEKTYYAYRRVTTPGRTMLIEFGEMTCAAQERWMEPRLHELGIEVARFIRSELQP